MGRLDDRCGRGVVFVLAVGDCGYAVGGMMPIDRFQLDDNDDEEYYLSVCRVDDFLIIAIASHNPRVKEYAVEVNLTDFMDGLKMLRKDLDKKQVAPL